MESVSHKIIAAMQRNLQQLPVKLQISIPLPYHKAAFGFVNKTLTKAEAQRIFGTFAKKTYDRGGYAKIDDNTCIDHIAGNTIVLLHYTVYNSAGVVMWPVGK
jgi:hypothetical protein